MSNGFLFEQLSDFKKKLYKDAQELFPKETNNFLTENAKAFKKEVQKTANSEVKKGDTRLNHKGKPTNYHKKFKVGKKYKRDGNICIRVFNSARHAHLIEQGHILKSKSGKPIKFVSGKYVFKLAELHYTPEFLDRAEKFLYQFFDKTTEV